MAKKQTLDAMQLAKRIGDIATGQRDEGVAPQPPQNRPVPTSDEISRVMSALGRLGGAKGGDARAAKLSKRRRSQIAKDAASARWGKK